MTTLRAWAQVGSLPAPLESMAAVSFNGALYVSGGYGSTKVYRSTNGGGTWAAIGDVTVPPPTFTPTLFGHAMVVFNGRIYVIGGSLDAGVADGVYSSLDGATWTPEASLPIPLTFFGCAVFDGKIWAVSGYSSGGSASQKVFTFDGATWTEVGVDAFPIGAQAFGLVEYAGTLWATGGFVAGSAVSSKKVFKLANDKATWTEVGVDTLPQAVEGHVSFALGDALWIAGGYESTGVSTVSSRKVYKTTDGLTWEEEGTDALPRPFAYGAGLATTSAAYTFGGWDNDAAVDLNAVYRAAAAMLDSSSVENALVNKLRDDVELATLLPDGVYYGMADEGLTRFCIVSMATEHDEPMFGFRAFEDYNFLVKAVVLNDVDGTSRKAAARIDLILDPPPPAPRATLDVEGYGLMVLRRIDRVRYPDPDPEDPKIVWQHRGGHYQVMVYPRTKA